MVAAVKKPMSEMCIVVFYLVSIFLQITGQYICMNYHFNRHMPVFQECIHLTPTDSPKNIYFSFGIM